MKKATIATCFILAASAASFGGSAALAQPVGPSAAPTAPTAPMAQTAPTEQAPLKSEQLDQMLAPVALYSDPLLAQVLMASTYPLEVVQAARWQKANKTSTGKALEDKLLKQDWDESVKALVAVPEVLQMMDEKIDWTQQLGDAFLGQREDVMASVQRLRALAQNKGNLQSTKQQKVSTKTQGNKTAIVIEPENADIAYVPVYDPAVIYGDWPYPEYPPYDYYPYGYYPGTGLAFTAAIAVGAAIWGNCNWWNNNVDIDINRYNRFNRANISDGNWRHHVEHRRDVPYRNANVARQFDRNQGAGSRDAARTKAASDLKTRQGQKTGAAASKGGGTKQAANARPKQNAGTKQGAKQKAASNRASAGNKAVNRSARANNAFANIDRGGLNRGGGPRQIGATPRGGPPRAALGGGGRSFAGGGSFSGGSRSFSGGGRGGGGGGRGGRR